MATIAIIHVGLGGHIGPATRLGQVLVAQGHRVIAWGPEYSRSGIKSTRAEFRAFDPAPVNRLKGGLAGFAALLLDGTERRVGELIDQLLAEDVELAIHDHHAVWGQVAADFLGLPRIVSNPLFPAAGKSRASGGGVVELFPDGWEEAAGRAHASRLAIGRIWGIELGEWHEAINCGGATVTYTTEKIVGPDRARSDVCYLGPLMASMPPQCRADPPLVYSAFGTFTNFRPDVYRAVIEALADERVHVVLSTGGGRLPPDALEPLPANVTVHEFVDSRQVLSRATVHVTHAGGGSVQESLLAGVPMVCLPQAVDQFLWAERVEQLGAGRRVDADTAAITAAVRDLIDDPKPREAALALGQHLSGYDGARYVAKAVARALGQRAVPTTCFSAAGSSAGPSSGTCS